MLNNIHYPANLKAQKTTPAPFSSVYIRNSTYGTVANENGDYKFNLGPGTYTVVYRSPGYNEQATTITITDHDVTKDIQFIGEAFRFNQVSDKWQYNADPGDTIMRLVLKNRVKHMKEVDSYSCAVYIKGVQKLVSSPKSLSSLAVTRALDLDSMGRGILYQSESLSQFNFKSPDKVREVTIASKTAGINTAFSYNKASDLQVNFYNDIFTINGLSTRGYISPVGETGFSHYKYKLIGSTVQNGRTIDKIQVIPNHRYGQYFQGFVYIVEGEWRIYSVDLFLDNKTNSLNLVDTLQIKQQYIPITDSVWMPLSVSFDFKGTVLGFKFAGYYSGVYNNYKINPVFPDGFFTGEVLKVDTAANIKTSAYWDNARPVPLTRQETRDFQKKDSVAAYKKKPPLT